MPNTDPPRRLPQKLESLQQRLDYLARARDLEHRIHGSGEINEILLHLRSELMEFLQAEHLTIYAVDQRDNALYSRYWDQVEPGRLREIRVPIRDWSIAGFCARSRETVNIADAYDEKELARVSPRLAFDRSWDQKTGVRTRAMLTVPALASDGRLAGVIQLVNKRAGGRFTGDDEARVKDIARSIGLALEKLYRVVGDAPSPFQLLVEEKLVGEKELKAAVVEACEREADLEVLLEQKYKVGKRDLGRCLSRFFGLEFITLGENPRLPNGLLKGLNPGYLKTHLWVPLRRTDDAVDILANDPKRVQGTDELFPDKDIRIFLGLRQEILALIDSADSPEGGQAAKDSVARILDELEKAPAPAAAGVEEDALSERDNAIVRLSHKIILDALKEGASDIHVESYSQRHTVIRFRIDGLLYEYQKLPPPYRRALVSRFKIMANLDISVRNKPQDGKIKFRPPGKPEIELRVVSIPTVGIDNEDLVMRILSAGEPMPMERLSLSERNLREFKALLEKPNGIFLCVGPTGSGKTTTLHSAIGLLNDGQTKIWTAEDPVEITQYGIRQVQVARKAGLDFAVAMRAFVRADPDIIMVGEMRDAETARMAIEASLTGHLVLSTLHTNSAAETVVRLLELGVDPFSFSDALLGIVAQRLARKLCRCAEPWTPSDKERLALERAYGEAEFSQHFSGVKAAPRRAKGCDDCRGTGYLGRIPLHELLVVDPEIRRLILSRAPATEIRAAAKRTGMTTLLQDGIAKILAGLTDYRQVSAVAGA